MRIAQLAPTYERVPPRTYGGTELIVHLLTEELVRRGHHVTLFATGDSVTSARLVSVADRPHRYGDPDGPRHPEYLHLANAHACFEAAARGAFDLIHNHAGIEGIALAARSETPVLTTTHLGWSDEARTLWDAYPWTHHQLSRSQAATFPSRGQLAPVHHGLDLSTFVPRLDGAGRGHLLFLGRFTPVKGPHTAIDVARAAGRRIVLAGKVDGADRAWYERAIAPRADGVDVVLAGEVAGAEKHRLLAEAAALLSPIEWDEPFGLVMVEAMASGTPVVAFARGSVPELVDDGVSGFVAADVDGMRDAVTRLGELDRAGVRARAAERFTVDRMVDSLLERYAQTLEHAPFAERASPARAG